MKITQQGDSTLNSNMGSVRKTNLTTLGKIPEQEKIQIIKTGFQRNKDKKISLTNYYESVSEANSLFQLKGYSIKYESIRKTKLYQSLKTPRKT